MNIMLNTAPRLTFDKYDVAGVDSIPETSRRHVTPDTKNV
jgi:hypothetical protein